MEGFVLQGRIDVGAQSGDVHQGGDSRGLVAKSQRT